MHTYFFISSKIDDVVNSLTIITTDPVRAYILAHRYFRVHKAKGKPMMLAI